MNTPRYGIAAPKRILIVASAVFIAIFGSPMVVQASSAATPITRASTDVNGNESNAFSSEPTISADGRYVVFTSSASNLVPGDTNGVQDVFVKNIQTGAIVRASTDSSGNESNGASATGVANPTISADGRYVVFTSFASNLVPGDTNGIQDIFVKDLQTGAIVRASTDSSGNESNGASFTPSISADGRYVAFMSQASNLVAGDTNGASDTFVKDLQTGTTTRVSTDVNGNESNSDTIGTTISADGRYVAFSSHATNLVPGDTNATSDVFVKDVQTGAIVRASTDSDGNEGNGFSSNGSISLSATGRYVVFNSFASNLVPGDTNGVQDVFVKDLQTGTTTRVSTDSDGNESNDSSFTPFISAGGRYVVFVADATNLVPGDINGIRDVFVKDLQTGTTTRVSTDVNGNESNSNSFRPSISTDGRYVVFQSFASNLIPDDTNGAADIFVKDLAETPDAPTNPTVGNVSKSSISFSWTAPVDYGKAPITGYQIERSINHGPFAVLIANTNSTSTSYQDTGLNPGTTYTYRISAINDQGVGSPSDVLSVTTLGDTDVLAPTGTDMMSYVATGGSLAAISGVVIMAKRARRTPRSTRSYSMR